MTYVMNHQIDDVRTFTTTTAVTDNSDDDTSVASVVLWGLSTTACALTLHTTVVLYYSSVAPPDRAQETAGYSFCRVLSRLASCSGGTVVAVVAAQ